MACRLQGSLVFRTVALQCVIVVKFGHPRLQPCLDRNQGFRHFCRENQFTSSEAGGLGWLGWAGRAVLWHGILVTGQLVFDVLVCFFNVLRSFTVFLIVLSCFRSGSSTASSGCCGSFAVVVNRFNVVIVFLAGLG